MSDIKFSLLQPECHHTVGETDLKHYLNRPLYAGGCTIFLCHKGWAIVSINFRKRILKQKEILFLFSDTVFITLQTSHLFSAFYCTVSKGLLNESSYNIPWDFYNFLYIHPICSTSEEQYRQLQQWQEQVIWFSQPPSSVQQYPAIRNALQNLFLGVDREVKKTPEFLNMTQKKDRAWELMNQLYQLLTQHCTSNRNVQFYADQLCITPYYLYKITYKILQLSPKELIDEQVIVEIKMHLTCTSLSIKEIAEKLNFEDPSYMCRFFRRHTGKSLSDYKSEWI